MKIKVSSGFKVVPYMDIELSKPKKVKKPKKLTYAKAKKDAWKVFSLYIRTRDSHDGKAICFTCEYLFPIKELQAGHFVPGRKNVLLFHEQNCHQQCLRCNVFLKGNLIEYYPRMVEKYGLDTIEALKLVALKEKYQALLDLLGWRE